MTRELDTLRKRQWRFERQNRWDYLPRAKQLQAIAILVLAGWNAVIAAEFCIAQALRRHSDAVQDVSLWAASVSEWCLACTDEAIASIHHPNNKQQERVRQEAIKWLAERETVEWCKHQNFDHGVAPSTNVLANRFVKFVSNRQGASASVDVAALSASAEKRFGTRLRRSWGLSFGTMPAREEIPEEEKQAKARPP